MAGDVNSAGLEHSALFYRGDEEFLDAVVPFVLDGVRNSEPVFVAVPAHNLRLLRDALGEAAGSVALADMTEVGANPARVFGEFSMLLQQRADEPMRWVGEPVWPGRAAEEYPACVQNEALVNIAFPGFDLKTLCPYDAAGLSDDVLADARRTHPLIREGGTLSRSTDFAVDEALARCNEPLFTDPGAVTLDIHDLNELSHARDFAIHYAGGVGLSATGIGDLQLIITELVTNSINYTGAGCRLALWTNAGALVCEVRDHGHLDDPLVGRRAPTDRATSGRGLFLINAIADLVRTHTSPTGTTMQVHLRLTNSSEVVA